MAHLCPSDGRDYHGRCLGECRECGEHLESTGRYTTYCPSCDTCPECGCPAADGFAHYAGCPVLDASEESEFAGIDGWMDGDTAEHEDLPYVSEVAGAPEEVTA